ncbi:MAG: helix-turn-helix domain-containing protein [Pseudonocardia sp.]
MAGEVERIAQIDDPFELIRATTERLGAAQQEVTDLARLRRRKIQDLHDEGLSYAQIAEAAGLSRARIHQVRHSGPPPEGFFLGAGAVVVATPLKQDVIQARPVVAVEDVTATQRLGELAQSLGMAFRAEHVTTDGAIDLNRPNLVVICGPRISDVVAAVLAQDRFITFERDTDQPWTLRDLHTGAVYRSGWDDDPQQPYDFAYLGRLPRPDGHGSLLVFTGIHPPGSLGVVHLLTSRLAELYESVKDRPFSAVVRTDYDPTIREPTHVELVTPLYEPEH